MKSIIIIAGMSLFALSFSFSNNEQVGAVMFLFGLSAAVSVVVVPFAAMILNPMVSAFLSTSMGKKMGSKGKAIFKFIFAVPSFGSRSKRSHS